MKMTIDVHAELLARAKQHAKATGRSLRAVIEDCLRQVLAVPESKSNYQLPDLSVGDPNAADPLSSYSWQQLREPI